MKEKKIRQGTQFLPYAALRGYEKLVAMSFERSAKEEKIRAVPVGEEFSPDLPQEEPPAADGIRSFDDPVFDIP